MADWIRRSSSSWRRFSTSAVISSAVSLRTSLDFIVDLPLHHLGPDRQLVRGQPERLARLFFGHVGDLEHHTTGLDDRHPELDRALALTHAYFLRLLGYRLIGEDANVDLTSPLEVATHGHATRFDLVRLDPGGLHGDEAVVTEGNVVAALGVAGHAAAHLLAVLDAFG